MFLHTVFVLLLSLTVLAQTQQAKLPPDTTSLIAAESIASCTGGGEPGVLLDCQRRETARLFVILGRPEVALRILCNTNAAIEAFRPDGVLTDNKYENNVPAYRRCLDAVKLDRIKQ